MNVFKYYILLTLIVTLLALGGRFAVPAFAVPSASTLFGYSDSLKQELTDSTLLKQAPVDKAVSDTLARDSVASDSVKASKKAMLSAVVQYEATDSTVFELDSMSLAHLFGQAKITYLTSELTADKISMNIDSSTVYAVGSPDSTGKGTIGDPVFKDGLTPYDSKSMRYNFKSKRGFIHNVVSQQGEGYVTSFNSKKDSLDNLYMKDGRYTTCDDHEHPHFYLALTRAKVRPKKNVVFGPAYLVVSDVPIPLGVPFGFFPFTSSYSSGFIMPSYGDDTERGFYLQDGGYYFAISDYMDLKLTGEIYTKGSWGLDVGSSYRKRYKYSGNYLFDYLYTVTGEKNMPDYAVSRDMKLQWSHRQDSKAWPNRSFSASVNFSTSSYEHSNLTSYYNPTLYSQNTKTSSVSYSQNFPDKKLTLSAGLNLSQTTRDSTISLSFPNLTVSVSSFYPFKREKSAGSERWYEKIRMSYSGQLANSITTKEDKLLKSNLIKDWRNGIKHEVPISATFTLFNYLNISPSINYTERWYTNKVLQSYDQEHSTVVRDTVYGFNRVYNYSASLGFSTKLYGMYTPIRKLMGEKVRQIRHVFTPTLTFSAAPDFGSRSYGYYKTYDYIDAYGVQKTVEYSPYSGQLYGVPGTGKTGSVSISLSNNLEMKMASKRDSTGIKKVSLIDELGLGMSYNMAAETKPWSDLSMRLRLKFTKNYTFNMSTTFATYAYEFDENGKVYVGNRTEYSHGRFGRFQGTSFSHSYTFNNATLKKWFSRGEEQKTNSSQPTAPSGESATEGDASPTLESVTTSEGTTPGAKKKEKKAEVDEDGYEKFAIPWSFSLSYSCRISENTSAKINPSNMRYPYKLTHSLSGSGNIKISNKWAFTFSTSYDFDAGEIATTSCNVSRDLHCFTMTCGFTPFGKWKSYNFSIRAKSSLLQDLKWDQRSSYSNNVAWY